MNRPNRWFDLLVEKHLPLLASGTLFLLFVIRLYAVSDFHASTAVALVSASSPTTVLVGAALSFLPVVIGGAAGLGAAWVSRFLRGPFVRLGTMEKLFSGLSILVVVALCARLLPAVVFILLLFFSLPLRPSENEGSRGAGLRRPFILAFVVLVVVNALVIARTMWLPAERLTLSTKDVKVGYVLDSDAQWTVLLTDDPRAVLRISTGAITRREYCVPKGMRGTRSLIEWVAGENDPNPDCP
jgi:hypothetical protein